MKYGQLIKCTSKGQGPKIQEYWKKHGFTNSNMLNCNSVGSYYGPVNPDNDKDIKMVFRPDPFEVIELPGTTKNQVIKSTNPTHGKQIIKYWESQGFVNRRNRDGSGSGCYYGPTDDGEIDMFTYIYDKEVITLPKEKNKFKMGDYIVSLERLTNTDSFPEHYVFKQRRSWDHLSVEKDIRGRENGATDCDFAMSSKWRYATQLEIDTYDKAGKPVDVRTLPDPNNGRLTFADLKDGEYYVYHYSDYKCIGKSRGDIGFYYAVNITTHDMYSANGNFGAAMYMTKASKAEIEWLEYCKEQGKFVSEADFQTAMHKKRVSSENKFLAGNYYTIQHPKSTKTFVTKCDVDSRISSHACMEEPHHAKNHSGPYSTASLYSMVRRSTVEEMNWLDDCNNQNKWIPFPKLPVEETKPLPFRATWYPKPVLPLEEVFKSEEINAKIQKLSGNSLFIEEEQPMDLGIKKKSITTINL